MKKLHCQYEDLVTFKFKLSIVALTIIFSFSVLDSVWALSKQEKTKMEADYILGCQYINPQDPAHGAINNV